MLQVCLHVFTKIDKHGSICAEIKQIKAFKLSYFEVLQWNNFIYFCPFRSIPLENYMFIAVLKCSQSNFFCFLFTLRTFQHSLYNEIVCFILFLSVCGNTVMSMYVPLHSTWDQFFREVPYTELNISLFHVVFYYRERFVKGWW